MTVTLTATLKSSYDITESDIKDTLEVSKLPDTLTQDQLNDLKENFMEGVIESAVENIAEITLEVKG